MTDIKSARTRVAIAIVNKDIDSIVNVLKTYKDSKFRTEVIAYFKQEEAEAVTKLTFGRNALDAITSRAL